MSHKNVTGTTTLLDYFTVALLFVIVFLPKFNLITLPGMSTGIRLEDFLLTLWIVVAFFGGKLRITSSEAKKTLLKYSAYLIICAISIVINSIIGNINFLLAIVFLLRKIEYIAFLYVGYTYISKNSKPKNKFLIHFFKASIVIHFLIILLQNVGIIGAIHMGTITDSISGGRLYSTFNGPYELSAYLIFLMPLLLNNIKTKKINILYLVLILASIYLSQSRTSLVIFFLVVIIFWAFSNKKSRKTTLKLLVVTFLSIIAAMNLGSLLEYMPRSEGLDISSMANTIKIAWQNRDIDRYISTGGKYDIYGNSSSDLSFRVRISRDMTLLQGVARNPLLGVGPSIVKVAADCNYIRLLAESGFLGLITFLSCLSFVYKTSKNSRNNEYSELVRYGIISLCLGSIFIDLFEASKIMTIFWFIVGVHYKQKDTPQESKEKKQ